MYVTQIPIASADNRTKGAITSLVRQILADPASPDVPRLESEIDTLINGLYNLTPGEIQIVECNAKSQGIKPPL